MENMKSEEIMNAAAKIFRKKGFHHATISEIAKEVDIQKGSLYHYFKGKEELLYKIILSALQLYVESLSNIDVYGKPVEDVIKNAILAHITPIDLHFDNIYVFINEIDALSTEHKAEINRELKNYESMWIRILEKGKASGVFRRDQDSKIIMLSIFGICNWTLRWYKPEGKYSARELGKMYAQFVLNGIKSNLTVSAEGEGVNIFGSVPPGAEARDQVITATFSDVT